MNPQVDFQNESRLRDVVDKAASITSLLSDTIFYNWAVWLNHNRALFDGSIKLFVFARWMILYFNIFYPNDINTDQVYMVIPTYWCV